MMPSEDRMEILRSIKGVDEVVLSSDFDLSVSRALTRLRPDFFANGGDVVEVREQRVCEEMGCQVITGLGEKIRSSSDYCKSK